MGSTLQNLAYYGLEFMIILQPFALRKKVIESMPQTQFFYDF